ncbi:MAG: hypothetical protein JSV29_01885 [Candidatus Bathyarchaeota archaeon]|nr:MAG: hypothetical protein JSV29_01885 [Candidatus Bathyarchaeota archaeon]
MFVNKYFDCSVIVYVKECSLKNSDILFRNELQEYLSIETKMALFQERPKIQAEWVSVCFFERNLGED